MRLLGVEHKTVWGGGQVMLVNVLGQWQRSEVPMELTLVCPPQAAIASHVGHLGIPCVLTELGAIEKTHSVAWNLSQRAAPTMQLLRTMRKSKIQVVLANSAFSFLASVFAAKLARVPIVWWEHNSTLQSDGLLRRMIRWADRIVVVSEEIQSQFLELDTLAAHKLGVIHNGVDAQKFFPSREKRIQTRRALGWDQSVRVVGTVGRLSTEKGIHYFVAAANEIAKTRTDMRFLIVGDGPERAALEASANLDAIRFVGMRENVVDWLNAMDVFVLSSPVEAFGLAVLEAMACRLPVIAPSVGELPNIVDGHKTGLLVPPRDTNALARMIADLAVDTARCDAMGTAGRARVEQKFLLKQTAHKLRAVMQGAVGVG